MKEREGLMRLCAHALIAEIRCLESKLPTSDPVIVMQNIAKIRKKQKELLSTNLLIMSNEILDEDNVPIIGQCLGAKVIWRGYVHCIVTNASACGGKKITVSPVGNRKSPAKYYDLYPTEVTFAN